MISNGKFLIHDWFHKFDPRDLIITRSQWCPDQRNQTKLQKISDASVPYNCLQMHHSLVLSEEFIQTFFPTHVYQYFIYLAVHWPLIWIIHSSKTCNVFNKLVNKMCNRQSMLRLLQWHLCHVYRIQLNYEASSRTLTIQLTLDFSCTSKLVQAFWIPWFTDFYWHIHENLHQIFCSNHCGSTIIWKQQCTWSNYLNEIRIWQ